MSDQPSLPPARERFKAEMPHIPGVSATLPARTSVIGHRWIVAGGLTFLVLAVMVTARYLSKPHRAEIAAPVVAQIDVPAPIPDLPVSLPIDAETDQVIATIGELVNPWSFKTFVFHDPTSKVSVAALLIRLPGGSASRPSGYWSTTMKPIYGNCQLDYVEDVQKLRTDYGHRRATHPMLANPCTRSLYDPLQYAALPGDILARGAVVQGSDVRPPLGIEIKLKDKQILAIRME